jgi:hypothetical protein
LAGLTLNYQSCVTDDGIELSSKAIGSRGDVITSVEATAVDRRPVAAAEAHPPADLLKIDDWFTETGSSPDRGPPDFEVVMQRDGASTVMHTTRRRGHWVYEEETAGGVLTTLSIHNAARGLNFAVGGFDTDKPILSLSTRSQADLAQVAAAAGPMKPHPLGRHEIILGERCEWFDMAPGMADRWYSACRTDDGITLKNLRGARGYGTFTDVAVRLARRAIALDEIKPPPALLDRKTWNLPD